MNMQPPHNLEVERAVLGILMDEAANAGEYLHEYIDSEIFYDERHRDILRAIRKCLESGLCNLLTVTSELREQGILARIGGPAYIAGVCNSTCGIADSIPYYASILWDCYARRRLMLACQKVLDYCRGLSSSEIIEQLVKVIEDVRFNKQEYENTNPSEALRRHWDLIAKGMKPFIPSGLTHIDEKLNGGFNLNYPVVIKGSPGRGKTALLLQMLDSMVGQGSKVLLFSLEMRKEEAWARVVAGRLYRAGLIFDNFNYSCLSNTGAWLAGNPKLRPYFENTDGWQIEDREGMKPEYCINRINQAVKKDKVDVIAIDHMNMIEFSGVSAQSDRESFCDRIRCIAKSKRVLPILVVQHHVKDGRAYYFTTLIHQAAAVLEVEMSKETGECVIVLSKNRFGGWGKVKYKFIGGVQTFQRPEGGGYYVPRRDSFRVKETDKAKEQSPQAEGRVDSGLGGEGETCGALSGNSRQTSEADRNTANYIKEGTPSIQGSEVLLRGEGTGEARSGGIDDPGEPPPELGDEDFF